MVTTSCCAQAARCGGSQADRPAASFDEGAFAGHASQTAAERIPLPSCCPPSTRSPQLPMGCNMHANQCHACPAEPRPRELGDLKGRPSLRLVRSRSSRWAITGAIESTQSCTSLLTGSHVQFIRQATHCCWLQRCTCRTWRLMRSIGQGPARSVRWLCLPQAKNATSSAPAVAADHMYNDSTAPPSDEVAEDDNNVTFDMDDDHTDLPVLSKVCFCLLSFAGPMRMCPQILSRRWVLLLCLVC